MFDTALTGHVAASEEIRFECKNISNIYLSLCDKWICNSSIDVEGKYGDLFNKPLGI